MKNTKSLLALFMACMMIISCFVITPVVAESELEFDTWDDEMDVSWYDAETNEFVIYTAEALAGLAAISNGTAEGIEQDNFDGKTIYLGANIRLQAAGTDTSGYAAWTNTTNGIKTWIPISNTTTDANAFRGTIDGQGNTIDGMFVYQATRSSFVGYVYASACIKNIKFTNATVFGSDSGTSVVAGQQTGTGFTFELQDITVTNAYVTNTASGGTATILGRHGGFTAINFTNCDVDGAVVDVTSTHQGGGIVGRAGSGNFGTMTMDGCDVTNTSVLGQYGIGGLYAGVHSTWLSNSESANKLIIKNCNLIDVTVEASANWNVGGVVGVLRFGSSSSAMASDYGEITVEKSKFDFAELTGFGGMGGIIGYCYGGKSFVVNGVTLTGDISAKTGGSGSGVGGFIGNLNAPSMTVEVDGCNVTPKIDSKVNSAAGLFGYNYAKNVEISNSTIAPTVYGTDSVGSIVGRIHTTGAEYTITNCGLGGTLTASSNCVGALANNEASEAIFTFEGCYSYATMNSSSDRVGAFIGDSNINEVTYIIRNCYSNSSLTGTNKVGGLIGYAASSVSEFTVENTVVLGSLNATDETLSNAIWIGALAGRFGTDSKVNAGTEQNKISNFYYNATFTGLDDTPKLGVFLGYTTAPVADTLTECTYYTPGEDNTEGLEKQPNIKIVEFLEAMKDSTLEVEHTCTPVEMDQENAAKTATMTLECQVPGCKNHKLADATDLFVQYGSSIRVTGNPGMRFVFGVDPLLDAGRENVNVGVVMMPNELLGGATLTIDTENALVIPAAKIFSENNKDYHEGVVTFSGVLTSIPSTVEAWNTVIAVRAYVQIGDTVYYSATYGASYKSTAEAVKAAGGTDYTDNQTFIDNIIAENVSAQ